MPPSSGAGQTPNTPSGIGGGASPGGVTGGIGGLAGNAADAGLGAAPGGQDAGAVAGDASVFPDASIDAGVPDAASEGGAPEGGFEAGLPDASDASDAGCPEPLPPDAGVCAGYNCLRTREQLRAAMNPQGACSSEQAVALACDGRVGKAALQCTQESVFALNVERAVTTCLKRDTAIGQLSNGCLGCFVDEALCTLSRCFAACTLTEGSDCKACRQTLCSAALATCSGLPAPSF